MQIAALYVIIAKVYLCIYIVDPRKIEQMANFTELDTQIVDTYYRIMKDF